MERALAAQHWERLGVNALAAAFVGSAVLAVELVLMTLRLMSIILLIDGFLPSWKPGFLGNIKHL